MGAEIRHQNDFLAFMTFDDEHHRMVIFTVPDTGERPPTANGIAPEQVEVSVFASGRVGVSLRASRSSPRVALAASERAVVAGAPPA